MGHYHFCVRDVAANARFWTTLASASAKATGRSTHLTHARLTAAAEVRRGSPKLASADRPQPTHTMMRAPRGAHRRSASLRSSPSSSATRSRTVPSGRVVGSSSTSLPFSTRARRGLMGLLYGSKAVYDKGGSQSFLSLLCSADVAGAHRRTIVTAQSMPIARYRSGHRHEDGVDQSSFMDSDGNEGPDGKTLAGWSSSERRMC